MSDVAGRHPLKQGLKPLEVKVGAAASERVAGRHPLKQGLKLYGKASMATS